MVTFPRAKHTLHDPLNSQTKDKLVMTNKQINASFLPTIANGEVPRTFGTKAIAVMLLMGDEYPTNSGAPILGMPTDSIDGYGLRREVHLRPQDLAKPWTGPEIWSISVQPYVG